MRYPCAGIIDGYIAQIDESSKNMYNVKILENENEG